MATTLNRIDGRLKVTGAAQYAAEFPFPATAHGVLVGSTISSGYIRTIDSSAASQLPGVLLVLTHENRGALGKMPTTFAEGGLPPEIRPPLEDNRIFYAGQYVALVVAETLEHARRAAALLHIVYYAQPSSVSIDDKTAATFWPEQANGDPLTVSRGDFAAAHTASAVRLAETYITPNEHPCALEPHASVAFWEDDSLTVHNASQWVGGDLAVLTAAFRLPPEKVRIICPFTGGMFGSKAATPANALLAALAARQLRRPVKVVLSRPQVLTNVGHRSETVQRLEIGAKPDGTIFALRHDVRTHSSIGDDFVEPAAITSRMLYQTASYKSSHEVVRLNVMNPSWMRAPGEAPGQFALESAMDELSYLLNIDPIELRRINHASVNAHNGKPFSSKHLLECYTLGAERFGWSARKPQPRSTRHGNTLIGYGTATATYPGYLMGAAVKVALSNDSSGIRATVSTAGNDSGTGLYTMLAIIAANALGLPVDNVTVQLGDSRLTPCAVAGGSNLTASTAPATYDACLEIKRQLLEIASQTADGFTGAHTLAEEFLFAGSRLAHRSHPARSIAYSGLLKLSGRPSIEAQAHTTPVFGQNDKYSFQSFGAHFVEVKVVEEIRRVSVSRIVSVFDCGRIMSPKTTRSQFSGGIVFGIGHALLEELTYDPQNGRPINADLAGYLVPVHADVPDIDVSWIDEPDYNFNSMGCRGVGEIGITGVAAAIANAVFHATGIRFRNLPITPGKWPTHGDENAESEPET
jgi:xanthine dehydrogenase YagR molybdenum-binding subunit